MTKKIFLPLWITGAVLLFLYSYTQVDLSLTLSRASIFQTIEKGFQYVGWFNRPLSAVLYSLIFIFLFTVYFLSVKNVSKLKIGRKTLWICIISITVILTLSYNAFSYDLFNYIFDAKIVTFYHLNPYVHKALDFPSDPMLSFMHWTHRTYPYGPFWLVLTIPLSFLGMQFFSITFFFFKILISASFLLTAWSIEKISNNLKYKNPLLPLAAFAFNPFVLLESLVSSHNDIVMMGLFMSGFYFVISRRQVRGWLLIIFSIATKFATLFTAVLLMVLRLLKKEKYIIEGSIVLMTAAVILASYRTTYQPWYFLYVMPFAALLSKKKYYFYPLLLITAGSIIFYVPFLYLGDWNPPVPQILNFLIISVSGLAVVCFGWFKFARKND